MLIDASYFTEWPRHIQNAQGPQMNINAQETKDAIMAYIRMFQWPFLKGVLGDRIGMDVTAYLKSIEKCLFDKKDAVMDQLIQRLKEPFANYVFYKILRDSNSQATMTGLVRLKCANDYVAPIRRQVSAWNDMVDMVADFSSWCKSSDCTVPGIITDSNFLTKINVLNL